MRPDLDPHDVEAIIKRHDELTRQTYLRYSEGACAQKSDFREGAGCRIAVIFIVAIVALTTLALAISGLPGSVT